MSIHVRSEEVWEAYLRRNLLIYVLSAIILVMGVIFGALAVKLLDGRQRSELEGHLNMFLEVFRPGESKATSRAFYARECILGNLKAMALAWGLGISVIGSPAVLAVLFARGFMVGLTVGFLVEEMWLKGVLLSLVSILPQNLLGIPGIILGCSGGISFAWSLVRRRLRSQRGPLGLEFLESVLHLGVACVALAGAGFVEGYVTPVFIQLVTRYVPM